MKAFCMWCDKPTLRWCDAVIGIEPTSCVRNGDGSVKALLVDLESTQWTCDTPMCAEHTTQVGRISGSSPDSIDHCPHHAAAGEQRMADLVMFKDEAERARRELHAQIRRSRMRP